MPPRTTTGSNTAIGRPPMMMMAFGSEPDVGTGADGSVQPIARADRATKRPMARRCIEPPALGWGEPAPSSRGHPAAAGGGCASGAPHRSLDREVAPTWLSAPRHAASYVEAQAPPECGHGLPRGRTLAVGDDGSSARHHRGAGRV